MNRCKRFYSFQIATIESVVIIFGVMMMLVLANGDKKFQYLKDAFNYLGFWYFASFEILLHNRLPSDGL